MDIAYEFIELNRLFVYLMLFFLCDAVRFYFSWRHKKVENSELELLKTSFDLDEA